MSINDNYTISQNEAHYLNQLEITNKELKQANDIIERSSIIVFEWSIGPGIPVKFVTKNISVFGYSEEDFYSNIVDYWDFVYEKDVEKTQNMVWQAREKKELNQYKHIYRIKCKNGDIRWVEEWTILERNLNNELVSEKGILRDITDQIETAEKLKQSEERYRNLFENAGAVMCTIDIHGNFTAVNNACINLTGYDKGELLNMNIGNLIIKDNFLNAKCDDIMELLITYLNTNIQISINTRSNEILILETSPTILYQDDEPFEIQMVAQDVTSRIVAEKKIHHLTFHDKLTNLYNRAYFDEALEALDIKKEYPYSIIMGDMNGLKLTNDTFGHKTGDCLLLQTANIIKTSCPDNAIVARLGGDEFAIILPKCADNGAIKVCENIVDLCAKSNNNEIKPSIALGYSVKHDNIKTAEKVLKEADDNMYKNKSYKNRNNKCSIALSSNLLYSGVQLD